MTTRKAIIRLDPSGIVGIVPAYMPRVELPGLIWVSPVETGWEGFGFKIVDVIDFAPPEGKVAVGEPSYAIVNGSVVETYAVEDIPPPPDPGPPFLTPRQIRLKLASEGQLAAVEAAIDGLAEPDRTMAKIEWDYASEYVRSHPLVAQIMAIIGVSEQQADQWWSEAALL